jgi:hypothetical protein
VDRNVLSILRYLHFKLFLTNRSIKADAAVSGVSGHDGEFDDASHSEAAQGPSS